MSDNVHQPFFCYARAGRIARFSRLDIGERLAAASLATNRTPVVENGLGR
jgi:hypothetical protein